MQVVVVIQSEHGLIKEGYTCEPSLTLSEFFRTNQIPQTPGFAFSVWGDTKEDDYVLQEGDRIELSGPLLIDPKVARARRAEIKKSSAYSGKRRHAKRNKDKEIP